LEMINPKHNGLFHILVGFRLLGRGFLFNKVFTRYKPVISVKKK
jgi:hypothetical protein